MASQQLQRFQNIEIIQSLPPSFLNHVPQPEPACYRQTSTALPRQSVSEVHNVLPYRSWPHRFHGLHGKHVRKILPEPDQVTGYNNWR